MGREEGGQSGRSRQGARAQEPICSDKRFGKQPMGRRRGTGFVESGSRAGHDNAVAVHERLLLREAAITLLEGQRQDLISLILRKEKKKEKRNRLDVAKAFSE